MEAASISISFFLILVITFNFKNIRKLYLLSALILLLGCNSGGDNEGTCCDAHGGYATCMHELILDSHGNIVWSKKGKVTCNERLPDGNNYQCDEECD